MEPCALLPHYVLSFTKLSLWGSQILSTYFLIEEALWKMENNEKVMCKVPLWILFFLSKFVLFGVYIPTWFFILIWCKLLQNDKKNLENLNLSQGFFWNFLFFRNYLILGSKMLTWYSILRQSIGAKNDKIFSENIEIFPVFLDTFF